ncbi:MULTISPECIES: Imm50 family immunity protein [unclassified Streptomyces]|uniref:Imm50 family immunity protein n=1 Tax=unclassified Streptomyces TaxID=2593676 RepID=UPI0033AEA62A
MNESDWTGIVGSTEEVTDTYTTPPDLNECRLQYAQIDERDMSITLMFETTELPDKPPLAWADREYNTVEMYLRFTGVKGLRVNGWEAGVCNAEVTLTPQGEKGVRVSLEAADSQLFFEASASSVTRTRAYLSGGE